jgi:hypothetical protein
MAHGLSVAAMVLDENSYLPEWMAYHRLVGVDHFFLLDNGSQVPIKEVLAEEIALGRATVVDFKMRGVHREAFNSILSQFGHLTRWMAFIDPDEFLVPKSADDIPSILRDFEDFGGLAVNWMLFGSSGHKVRPSGLQIENFTTRNPDAHPSNTFVKSIIQPGKTSESGGPHHFLYKPGFFAVNEKKSPCESLHSPPSFDRIQLNHYQLRSRQEFEEKLARWKGTGYRINMGLFDLHEKSCTVRDDSILRFVPKVRGLLGTAI